MEKQFYTTRKLWTHIALAFLLVAGLARETNAVTCASAINITSQLPIFSMALTCGTTNDLSATTVPTACGGATNAYKGGNEALYYFTAPSTGSYTISYSGQSWTSIFVYEGCPTSGGTCVNSIGNSLTSKNLTVTLTSGLDYYIWFDTWPSPNSPCAGTFSISLPPVPAAPTVLTGSSSAITNAQATLGGSIPNPGYPAVTASGIVLSTSSAPTRGAFGVVDSPTSPLVGNGAYTKTFTGLASGTTYYYRAYAENTTGITYGADSTFTTNASASLATVLRNVSSNVQAYTATIGGNITLDGGATITASGVVYSSTNNLPTTATTGVVDSTTTPLVLSGSFSFNLAGLTPSTKYYFRAYAVNSVGTAYSILDSFTTAPVITVLPYMQNFDSTGVNTGWGSEIVGGTLNNWALGTPSKTFLTGAFSAPNAWVTKLTGAYDDNHNAALVSPQFDFTTQTVAPIIRFKHKFVSEPGWDALVVEISINGGAWTKLDNTIGTGGNFNTTASTSWYNSSSTSGPITPPKFSSINTGVGSNGIYSSQVGGWITSVTSLTGAAGQSNVKFRFRFGSDASGTDEGWAIDDIEVLLPTAPVVSTGTKTNVTTSNVTLSGSVIANGGNAITASGVVIGTSPSPVRGAFGVIDSTTNPLVVAGSFNLNITGLAAATTYYYRSYAVNGVGTSYGADSTFTTNASAVIPTISSTAATGITGFAATVGANISSDGGSTITASGIVYGTTPNPTIGAPGVIDSTTIPAVTIGGFSKTLGGLTHSTKYYFRAYATNGVGTAYSIQDSFTTQLVVTTLPYSENFDNATTPWTASAINTGTNAWVRGTPAKSNLSGAFSAPNAFVTFLTGNYAGTEDCVVLSPQMDFSSQTAAPILRFKHKMDVDADLGWDGGVVEISINGGTWTRLDATAGTAPSYNTTNSIAWYNSTSASGTLGSPKWSVNTATSYTPNTGGWIISSTPLTGAAGQSNVRVRFRFWADGIVDEGWALDDIEVFVPSAPTVSTGTKTGLTTSNVTLAGNITNNGGSAITASGVVIGTTANPTRGSFGVIDSTTNPVIGSGVFTVNVTGLSAATTYYYRAYAVNAIGTTYGPDSTFTTNASAVVPTLNTVSASAITTTTATIGATIVSDGGATITSSGIVYSTSPNPAIGVFGVVDSMTFPTVVSGSYTVNPTGLTHSTKYYFRAYATNSAGTGYSTQDSFVTAPIVSSLPYSQDFESGNGGWSSSLTSTNTSVNWVIGIVTNNNWVLGTPGKTYLNGAHSGTKAWSTKLTGTYDIDHDASVTSPQFDLTNVTSDPIVRFYHKFKSELDWDGLIIEQSVNGGFWTRVDSVVGTGTNFNTLKSYAWYNNNVNNVPSGGVLAPPYYSNDIGSGSVYSSQSSGWIQSAFKLVGAAGQSNVRFRFRFISDTYVVDEGWAIDDIEVVTVTTPTVAASNVISTPSATSANVSFSPGNGQGRLVVARLTSTTAVAPIDTILYTANAAFGSGSTTGTGNFVVYVGSGNSVNVTGLTALTGYSFDVYEFNGKYMHNKFAAVANGFTTTTPVKLLNFVAVKKSDDAILNWVTASEVNNSGFDVERSLDGKTFERIGFVKGRGNSNVKESYTFVDADLFRSGITKVYYRLKQLDYDGKYTYSSVIMLNNDINVGINVQAYPNPFNSTLTVDITTNKADLVTVDVFDISGRKVLSNQYTAEDGSNSFVIKKANELQSGIYFIKVQIAGTEKVIKLVKN